MTSQAKVSTPETDGIAINVKVQIWMKDNQVSGAPAASNPEYTLCVNVEERTFQGQNEGDLWLYPGSWLIDFELDTTDGSAFASGPVMIGPNTPYDPTTLDPEGSDQVSFSFTRESPTVVRVAFDLVKDSPMYQYTLQVLDPCQKLHTYDPKVVNRGYVPNVLPATPPLIP